MHLFIFQFTWLYLEILDLGKNHDSAPNTIRNYRPSQARRLRITSSQNENRSVMGLQTETINAISTLSHSFASLIRVSKATVRASFIVVQVVALSVNDEEHIMYSGVLKSRKVCSTTLTRCLQLTVT